MMPAGMFSHFLFSLYVKFEHHLQVPHTEIPDCFIFIFLAVMGHFSFLDRKLFNCFGFYNSFILVCSK